MDDTTYSYLNTISLFGVPAALTFAAATYWQAKAKREAAEKRIDALEMKLALVTQSVTPISAAIQAILIKELTHTHKVEMDALLVKVGPPNVLTPEEELRLAAMLKERSKDPDIPRSERDAAEILPAIIRRAEAEALEPIDTLSTAIVGVPLDDNVAPQNVGVPPAKEKQEEEK